MPKKANDIMKFWDELRRRKVMKATLVYLAAAFAILQACDIIFPRLGLPDWTVTFVIILLIIVFILVVVLTWVYDITPEGIKVTKETESADEDSGTGTPAPVKVAGEPEARSEKASEDLKLRQKVNDLEAQLREAREHSYRRLIKAGFRNLLVPVLVIAAALFLLFNREKISRLLGAGNEARETAMVHNSRAAGLIKSGDYESAQKEAEAALQADPGYSFAWGNMAVISYRLGDREKAILQATKAISLDPKNCYAPFNLALALHDNKEYDQAIRWYKEAVRIDSVNKRDTVYTAACSALGNLYNSVDRPLDAVIVLTRAMRQYPRSKYEYLLHRNLGNSYLIQAQPDSALRHLRISDNEKPSESETNYLLARAYETAGDITNSIETWRIYIGLEQDTSKVSTAKAHLKEITRAYLQEIAK